ncbi:AarF/ABC1/UbiB kinase family protein [Psychrosphaera sp.]|nr:AarF/ABC1/UbiB kinase family protein [Psychrosphaera sp.]
MLVDGAKQLSRGQKPSSQNLLLTPTNIGHVANKLSHLRGAAMKLGQMISMDAGELISPELSAVLGKLRSDAAPMQHKQLLTMLRSHWGEDWLDKFSQFELRPFAAASIGQVHLARLENGQKLAIKIQYPGVRDSIASDVDNVGTLLSMSGLLPSQVDISNLLEATKSQLQDEADYALEASYIKKYQSHLNSHEFILPQVDENLTKDDILVMRYVEGDTIERAITQPLEVRNQIVRNLIWLFLKELFDFRLMQTDPNFANFLYDPASKKIGLLDFGATRVIPPHISEGYQRLLEAGVNDNRDEAILAAKQIGFFNEQISPDYLDEVMKIFDMACEPLKYDGEFNFATSQLASRVRDVGLNIKNHRSEWHTPPVDALFIHRKLGGLYLLASKLNASVNIKEIYAEYVHDKNKT